MTKRQFKARILMALSLIAEREHGYSSGELYAAIMCDGCKLDEYQAVIEALKTAKWITESGHLLRATPKGAELGRRIKAAVLET